MTLPSMKIWTGGDREYSERVQRALFELGVRWVTEDTKVRAQDDHWLTVGFLAEEKLSFDFHDLNEGAEGLPAYRLAPNGNLVPAEADDEGWIAWCGSERPVSSGETVDVFDFSGSRIISKAFMIQWDTVTHYRVPSMVFETSQKLERDTDTESDMTDNKEEAKRLIAEILIEGGTCWILPGDWETLGESIDYDELVRRKPRTVRIEGEISEKVLKELRALSDGRPGPDFQSAASDILALVQDQ